MDMTQADYIERRKRTTAGTGTDEDRRLIKLYEKEGFSWDGRSSEPSTPGTPESTSTSRPAPRSNARSTSTRSNKGRSKDSFTASSAENSTT